MIKLLGIDLDGTLLYPKRRLTIMIKKNALFLRRFIENGGEVVLVSGRNPMLQKKIEKKVGHSISLLGCNGSYSVEDGKVFQSKPMNNADALEIYAKLRGRFGIQFWFLFDASNTMHMVTHGMKGILVGAARMVNLLSLNYREKIVVGEKAFVKALTEGTNFKLMPVFGIDRKAKDRAMQAYLAINDLFKDKLFVCESNNALEISALGANKASGLLEFCKRKGYSPNEVAVIGDSGNDKAMFEVFEHSFVMDHAEAHVQQAAKYKIHRVYDVEKYFDKIG